MFSRNFKSSRCLIPVAGLALLVGLPACAQEEVAAESVTLKAEPGETVELKLVDGSASDETAAAEDVAAPAKEEEVDPLKALKKELEELKLKAQLRTARLEAELAELKEENARLKRDYDTAQLQQRGELQPMELEKARLGLESDLDKARRAAETAPLTAELADLQTQQKLQQARLAAELAELKAQTQKLQAEQALAAAERQGQMAELQHEQMLLATQNQLQTQKLMAQRLETESAQAVAMARLNLTNVAVQQRDAETKLQNLVEEELVYREDPYQDGVLYISDRRIPLNGPIITGTADYICERIDYYNNEDPTKPIFIMIDNCPGGSVMQGYRIVKSIEASEAPVHVVVKSFAASMAAVITTLAEHSYAYPNAILLHHQMSAGAFGNMTDIEEQVETLQEWEARLAEPVAEKMGITVQEFKDLMYENKSSGDWDEFADRALELKWVNNIVEEVREEGIRQKPTGEAPKPWYWFLFAQDEHGQTYVNLPPAEPMDAYLMYNPNNFFRVDGR